MRHIDAYDFEANCLELIDEIHLTGETLAVLKDGRGLGYLEPIRPTPERDVSGGDDVAPLDDSPAPR